MKHLTVKVDANGTTDEVEVERAVKATQDSAGNNIAQYYAPKQTATGGFVAGGGDASASGTASIAIGSDALATNPNSIAIGSESRADSPSAVVIGYSSTIMMPNCIVIGEHSAASLSNSIVIGHSSYAKKENSIAIGNGANAAGTNTVAIGTDANATASAGIQIGSGTNAAGYSVQFANYPLLDLNTGTVFTERLLSMFPVGAYYITENAASPASLFGGEWVQVSGKFLLGQSVQDGYLVGAEGGEKTHTLTTEEMPQHSHKPHQFTWILSYGANTGQNVISGGSKGNANIFNVDDDQNRYTGTAGGNAAHNNMPPYRAVFIWRRTA